MNRIALLTCADFPALTDADRKLIPELLSFGITADIVIWDENDINLKQYDVLIFRSTWDYFTKQEAFSQWITNLIHQDIKTLNPLRVIKNNVHKFYLQDLERAGFKIIPSIFVPKSENIDLKDFIPVEWDKIVIKPAVSAGSYLTALFDRADAHNVHLRYKDILKFNDLIIQKFIHEIQTHGEISMVFFDKKFSHAVVKKPKDGDFRIQYQFGGTYYPYTPSKNLIDTGSKIVESIEDELLYARVDGVMIDDQFHLMELELIEPDLYMDYLPDGQKLFSAVIKKFLDNKE